MNIQLHLLQTQLQYALEQGMYTHAEYLEESIRLIKGKEIKMETSTKIWNPSHRPSLAEAQKFVGGMVELVPLGDNRQMLINEEGILEDLPINDEATSMASSANPYLGYPVVIRGDAIILQGDTQWN